MLRYSLGLETEALAVEHAVHHALANGALTADIAPKGTAAKSTSQVADAIIGQLAKGLVSGLRVTVAAEINVDSTSRA